jgi:hypothetical protein
VSQILKHFGQGTPRIAILGAGGMGRPDEVNKILSLTDDMLHAINLFAHLVHSEGCSNVLDRLRTIYWSHLVEFLACANPVAPGRSTAKK